MSAPGLFKYNRGINIIKQDFMWCVARFGAIVQFKKPEKHPWRSVNFSKVGTKINTPPWVFLVE